MQHRQGLKAYFASRQKYFREGRLEIAQDNLNTMKIAGSFGAAVCLIFFVIAPIIIPSWTVTKEYICILPVLLGAFLFSAIYSHRAKEINPVIVEIVCATFYTLILAVFIALSVFPYPDTPQIFISLCYMFIPVLLIVRPSVQIIIMLLSETVFLTLAIMHKSQFSIENDIFNTIASLLFSVIMMSVANGLRIRNFESRLELQRLSQTDALTGILNKKTFEEYCSLYLESPAANRNCAFLIFDLDRFKNVNDEHGHPFGDALLSRFGDILSKSFRKTDFVGRIGGDEFGAVLCGITDKEFLAQKCEELCKKFSDIIIDDNPFEARCSIGVFVSVGEPMNYSELFSEADKLMYKVKQYKKTKASSDTPIDWLISDEISATKEQ